MRVKVTLGVCLATGIDVNVPLKEARIDQEYRLAESATREYDIDVLLSQARVSRFLSEMKTVCLCFCPCLLILAFVSRLDAAPQSDLVSFNNQIQPILSEYCYPCHGPDSATRKPRKHPLRLDREQFAFEPRDDGKPVIIKGDAKASEVIRRLRATDDDVMPPASEHRKIKLEEIALIEKWITQGAKYEKHWSLIPPSRPAVPGDGKGWARNEIDRF